MYCQTSLDFEKVGEKRSTLVFITKEDENKYNETRGTEKPNLETCCYAKSRKPLGNPLLVQYPHRVSGQFIMDSLS